MHEREECGKAQLVFKMGAPFRCAGEHNFLLFLLKGGKQFK